MDLAPLIDVCWQRRIAVALPVLSGQRMAFASYRPDTALRDNRYGIPEPAAPHDGVDLTGEPPPLLPTVVLAPLVAFDDGGNRLGMGGGYYDRYFAAHPTALRVGVAHACQRVRRCPAILGICRWMRWSPSKVGGTSAAPQPNAGQFADNSEHGGAQDHSHGPPGVAAGR